MTMRDEILAAAKKAQAAGYLVRSGAWGIYRTIDGEWHVDGKRCLCPLAAVIIERQPSEYVGSVEETAAYTLGTSLSWVHSFAAGVDGKVDHYGPAYELAEEIMEKINSDAETKVDRPLKPLVPEASEAEPPAVWLALETVVK